MKYKLEPLSKIPAKVISILNFEFTGRDFLKPLAKELIEVNKDLIISGSTKKFWIQEYENNSIIKELTIRVENGNMEGFFSRLDRRFY